MSVEGTCDRALASSALIAIAVGFAGNAFFLFALWSPVAFSPLGLAAPIAAAVGLSAICILCGAEMVGAPRSAVISCAALLLPLLGFFLILDCLPPVARDELTHHLAIPALYTESRRIVEVPFADQSYYPMLVEMFYTPLLAWLPDCAPKFLHLLFGLSSAAVLGLAVRRDSTPGTGLIAVIVTLATPVIASLCTTAYVDLGLLLYTAVALATLLRWFDDGRPMWFVLSALSAGFTCATKYNGIMVLILLGLGTLLAPKRLRSAHALALAAAYVAIGLLPWAPWLAKNYIETRNPIFPLFNGLIGGRPLPDRPSVDIFTRRLYIHGESWLEIAAIPLRIFFTGREGVPAQFDGVLNPILLIGVVAACRRSARLEQRLLLGFATAYFLIAFFQTDMRVRYILPVVPALVLLTAPALASMLERRRSVAFAMLAAAVLFSGFHLLEKWRNLAPFDYLCGRVGRDQYVARFVPELPVLEYANRHLPRGGKIYLAFLGSRSYYCRRPFTYDTYFSGITLRQNVEKTGDSEQLLASFHDAGITYMIAADDLLRQYLTDTLPPDELERWDAFARSHLKSIASSNGISLYEIG